jgi:hypothetical protein
VEWLVGSRFIMLIKASRAPSPFIIYSKDNVLSSLMLFLLCKLSRIFIFPLAKNDLFSFFSFLKSFCHVLFGSVFLIDLALYPVEAFIVNEFILFINLREFFHGKKSMPHAITTLI